MAEPEVLAGREQAFFGVDVSKHERKTFWATEIIIATEVEPASVCLVSHYSRCSAMGFSHHLQESGSPGTYANAFEAVRGFTMVRALTLR